MIVITENDNRQLIETETDIIEAFEDFLEKRGITIENPEKEEDPEGASNIYGSDFGELQDAIEYILYSRGCVLTKNSWETHPIYIRVV